MSQVQLPIGYREPINDQFWEKYEEVLRLNIAYSKLEKFIERYFYDPNNEHDLYINLEPIYRAVRNARVLIRNKSAKFWTRLSPEQKDEGSSLFRKLYNEPDYPIMNEYLEQLHERVAKVLGKRSTLILWEKDLSVYKDWMKSHIQLSGNYLDEGDHLYKDMVLYCVQHIRDVLSTYHYCRSGHYHSCFAVLLENALNEGSIFNAAINFFTFNYYLQNEIFGDYVTEVRMRSLLFVSSSDASLLVNGDVKVSDKLEILYHHLGSQPLVHAIARLPERDLAAVLLMFGLITLEVRRSVFATLEQYMFKTDVERYKQIVEVVWEAEDCSYHMK